ncbi:hypothetical protein ACIBM4_10945 [Streptomyces sp. NPDC050256]|uniref:hypothetical protein n=1 Tax=Streptomyces sp. NPDC050256 TaxID=3365607 RepID=UPI00378D1436
MRMRRILGLAAATATLAGASAFGATTATAAPDPNVAVTETLCVELGGSVALDATLGRCCVYPDGHLAVIYSPAANFELETP